MNLWHVVVVKVDVAARNDDEHKKSSSSRKHMSSAPDHALRIRCDWLDLG